MLEVSGAATSSLFRTAIVNDNKAAGTLLMTTGGLNSGVEDEDVVGSSDVGVGTHTNVISLLVNDMVNVNTIKFAGNLVGQINDERGGAQTEGQLTVQSVDAVGIFVFAATSVLVNTAPLNGVNATTLISTLVVYNQAGKSDEVLTSDVSCSLHSGAAKDVLSMSDCEAVVGGSHLSGSAGVSIVVEYEACLLVPCECDLIAVGCFAREDRERSFVFEVLAVPAYGVLRIQHWREDCAGRSHISG